MNKIFKIQAFFEESHRESRPYCEKIMNWLYSKGFNAKKSCTSDTFFIHYESKKDGKLEKFKEKLDLHLLAISLRNWHDSALLIQNCFNNEEDAKINNLMMFPPSYEGMQYFEELSIKNKDLIAKLKELRNFYGQVDTHTKLIFGLSLLDEWFDQKPTHCLEKEEMEAVIENIRSIDIDESKKEKIIDLIKNPSFLAKKSKKSRIAESINKYCGGTIKAEVIVKELYKERAKSAHYTTSRLKTIDKNLSKLKTIFITYIIKEHKFTHLSLR